MDYPLLVFLISFVVLRMSMWLGEVIRRKGQSPEADTRADLNIILTATLTLLGLIIGFCFSMAIGRYDQRKDYEEAEANAIGTEYVRADLLAAEDAPKLRALLRNYLDQRVLFYKTRDSQKIVQINAVTTRLQAQMWSAVLPRSAAQQTPTFTLAVAGMNDVLNSQGYTQAAWWNRIPVAAWVLMLAIATCCSMMLAYGAQRYKAERTLLTILPFVVSISFFLIADIDSPRGGVIRVHPQNLESLVDQLRPSGVLVR
jgi:hypothetical protein